MGGVTSGAVGEVADTSPTSGVRAQGEGLRVSVVVPVYNAMPYLQTQLVSLLSQDIGAGSHEVIVVDDGSTDDGPRVLDELAAVHPALRVVHQGNSGWPGIPRNRGLAMARGRYVFFADADDEMGPEALRRLADFADEHGSDLVVPRSVGVGRFAATPFQDTRVDADLEAVFRTLTPQKLFRRSFLEREGLTFPEEKVRLEDGMFLARAYLLADRVSYLGGYDFYRLISREDGQNISSQTLDPDGYTWSVGEVSRLVRAHDPDPDRADRIVLDLYRRKCLKFYQPARWSVMPRARRARFLAAHGRFIEEHIRPELEAQLAEPFRTRSRLVRAGDAAALSRVARAGVDHPLLAARVVQAAWRPRGGLRLVVEIHGALADGTARAVVVELAVRGGGSTTTTVELGRARQVEQPEGRPGVSVVEAVVPRRLLDLAAGSTLDLSVRTAEGTTEKVRLAAPLVSVLPAPRHGLRVYSTVKGNLSVDRPVG